MSYVVTLLKYVKGAQSSNTQSNIVVQDKILRRHYGGQLFTIFYLKVKQTSENDI